MNGKFSVIGLMSGTSLDGLDIAGCVFEELHGKYSYQIDCAETIMLPETLKSELKRAPCMSGIDLIRLDRQYGHFMGAAVKKFAGKHQFTAQFVASHGYTVFHQPGELYTCQIGHGASLSAACNLPVVCDFRSADVAMGGQGAPLVPIGDKLLFGSYTHCLNIGGFTNISLDEKGTRLAWDICPSNIVLNRLAGNEGFEFDANGEIAASGEIIDKLLTELNNLPYYQQPHPKSLGSEWVEQNITPLLTAEKHSNKDLLRTFTEHIAFQISKHLTGTEGKDVLITGGGAHNKFLMSRISALCRSCFAPASIMITDYKEALIFAFLGLLRWKGENNCLASVTGAPADHSGGAIYII